MREIECKSDTKIKSVSIKKAWFSFTYSWQEHCSNITKYYLNFLKINPTSCLRFNEMYVKLLLEIYVCKRTFSSKSPFDSYKIGELCLHILLALSMQFWVVLCSAACSAYRLGCYSYCYLFRIREASSVCMKEMEKPTSQPNAWGQSVLNLKIIF